MSLPAPLDLIESINDLNESRGTVIPVKRLMMFVYSQEFFLNANKSLAHLYNLLHKFMQVVFKLVCDTSVFAHFSSIPS